MIFKITKTLVLTGLLGGLLLSSTAPVFAGDGNMGMKKEEFKKKWDEKIAEFDEKLGLSEEQKTQLKAHRETHRGQMKALYKEIKAKKEAIKAELEKSEFDAGQVQRIHAELKSLLAQKEDARLEGILQVRQILKPEQFVKFMNMKKEKDHKWHHGKDKDGDGMKKSEKTADQ